MWSSTFQTPLKTWSFISAVLLMLLSVTLQAHEALVLTHELAEVDRMEGYLAETLYPLNPLVLFGRSSKAHTREKKKEVVFEWWKDRCRKLLLR